MTERLLAEFLEPDQLIAATRTLGSSQHRLVDVFSPFPLTELPEPVGAHRPPIRPVMLISGIVVAAFAYALQWYSAVIDYPINSGGRPLFSWPVFLLVPFEVGVLVAALAGLIAFLWACGLPQLDNALFATPGFERATQDRFFLLAESTDPQATMRLRRLLEETDAVRVTQVWDAPA